MTTFGLTPLGFVTKSQDQIISELQTSFRTTFGQNINLGAESNFGQLIGIISEREALIWQLAEAIYASRYPSGAEGTSVDNILALNNLRRLSATPTRTNPIPVTQTNGIILNGLVLLGTAGTVVPHNSVVQTSASPPVQFTLDSDVLIAAAVNAIQSVFLSNTPTTGTFSLSIVAPSGNTLTTPLIAYNALTQVSQVTFSSVPVAGNFQIALSIAGTIETTANIPFTANAAAVQAAINLLAGYSGVTVTGSFAAGFQIAWNGVANPVVTIPSNTLGVTVTPIDSVQSSINGFHDVANSNYPFTDVTVTVGASGYNANFGVGTVVAGQPVTSAKAWPLFTVASNTMQMGFTVTNIKIVDSVNGSPAQGIGTATCTVTGPNFVAAGTINTIGTPVSGWNSVTNQLDCLTGTNLEDDTQALIRRQQNLDSQANGPLEAIIAKVKKVTNVTAVVGFENLNEADLQVITFSSVPVAGSFVIYVNGNPTAPVLFSDTASNVQTKIRAITGFSSTLVTGNFASGFTVDFNGSLGGQPLPLLSTASNTTGVSITVAFGRPGKSFEIVAEGGSDLDIANTIRASKPAGIQAYGSTVVQVFDQFGNPYNIGFSRPTTVPIYVVISLTTDLTQINPQFNPGSVATIQQDIVTIGNEVGIGGLIIGFGTNGLIGAFNNVPGIISYTLFFGTSPNPLTNTNIQMLSEQAPVFETFNVSVSYT